MDIGSLATLVIQKFKTAGGYSELPDKDLYRSIYKFLDKEYRKHFKAAQQALKDEEARGLFPIKENYDAAYIAVEEIVMEYANKLAATDRADI